MDEKEKELVVAEMKRVLVMGAEERERFIAQTIGGVYDLELPVPEVVSALADIKRADAGEHVYYLVPEDITKEVLTLSANCIVTQEKVTPSTRSELAFTSLISKEYHVCIHDWLQGDHDVIRFYADAIVESMDRQEVFATLALVDAGAVASTNVFTLDAPKVAFDYPKLIQMRKAVRKYGKKLVLITGSDVTEAIDLMDFEAGTYREFSIDKVVDQWISIEDLTVDVAGVTKNVIESNVAYLVAVSDSKGKKPILFSRRKLAGITDVADTKKAPKERVVMDTGNVINVGADAKFARGKAGFQQYGEVLLNAKVCAKFTQV